MSIKSEIHWLRAITAAGYTLVNNRSIEAHDGLCWHATLAHGRTKIVTASNGGFGGPDELDFCEDKKHPHSELEELLIKFRKLPQVIEYAREQQIEGLELSKQFSQLNDADYEAEKAGIIAGEPRVDDEVTAGVIARLADVTSFEKKLKRECKTKVCVVKAGAENADSYVVHKAADTPANRESIKTYHKEKFGYFIADLLDGKI